MILFLFLAHLGLGIAFTLAFVSREAGVKFFRFNAGLAAALIAAALVFRPDESGLEGADGGGGALARAGLYALGTAGAAVTFYWATIGRVLASVRPFVLGVACAAGVAALVAQAIDVSAGRPATVQALTVASFLSSSVFLGGACTAMILGHWYLVIPSLPVDHLQAIVKLHIASMVVRIAVVTSAVVFAIATWQPGLGPSFRHYIFSVSGIFFWQRVLFGLAGPVVLSYLTWETAKIRSTQSATGILYVDFFTVVVGEVLAKYLVLATRVPV